MAVGVVAIEFMGVKKVMGVVVAVEAPREKSRFFHKSCFIQGINASGKHSLIESRAMKIKSVAQPEFDMSGKDLNNH